MICFLCFVVWNIFTQVRCINVEALWSANFQALWKKWKATQHYGVHHHKCGRLLVLGNSLPHLNVVIPQKMLQCVHGQYSLLILFLYKSYLTFNLNSIYPSGPFLTIIMVVKSFFVSQNEVGNKKLVFHLLWPFSLPSEITTDHPIELWTFYISFSVWSHK